MAVIKIVNREVGKTYALKAVLDYIKNPKKTENGELVSAKDVLLECDYEQMLVTKLDYHKDTGRQYVHLIQSFSEHDKLDSKTAHEIGQKLLNRFDGFQGVVATHTDKKQLHNHIVLNSVNWQTGRKWQHSRQDLLELRKFSDKLCEEYGLSIISKVNSWQTSGEYQAGAKSWKFMLAKDIANALERSFNRSDFIHALDDLGIDADFGRNNIMFIISKEGSHRYGLDKELSCQNFKLSAYGDFSYSNIQNKLEVNNAILYLGKSDPQIMQDVLLTVGAMLFPNEPDTLQNQYFSGIDFAGLTKIEVEIAIAKSMTEKSLKSAMKLHEEAKNRKPIIVLDNIDLLFEEVYKLLKQQEMRDNGYNHYCEDREIEDELEL